MATRRRRVVNSLIVAAFVVVGIAGFVPVFPSGAQAAQQGEVVRSVTATRTAIAQDGTERVVSSNEVSLRVSQTDNLRGRQEIHVTWDGAVPTGGIVGDPNSSDARNQEYPFVLLQCRGVDTEGRVPRGQARLTPETCWTQTSTERYIAAASSTPSWRFDAHASEADRGPVVGSPTPLPEACAAVSEPLTARWLPFRAAGGEVYYGGPDPNIGCTSLAPESDSAESGGLPANTTYGITGVDGAGAADFAVWTAAENASLGCTAEVSCALVAVPIVGVSCDAFGHRLPEGAQQVSKSDVPLTESQLTTADATCQRTGAYAPGEPRSSTTTDQAVRGNLWWSASNWRNRITVPLDFALAGSVCDAVSSEPPQELMGSVVLNELTSSWRPKFCTTESLFTFTHVQQSDSLARTLVESGEIDAAFTSAPKAGGYARPVVQAPLAYGGFAIAFNIDDVERQRRLELKLNARLVAKLLSSSYPASSVMRDNHPSIGANPLNITLDPEFQALNPGLPQNTNLEAAAALQLFSTNSDLVWGLTSWMNADPEARSWLDGYADPWGMKVNEAYRGIALPLDAWPLLDTFVAPEFYQDQNACYANSPTPFMQLVSNPSSNIGSVLLNMQYASSSVQTVCKYDGYDPTTLPLRAQGRQTVGYRFVLGLVSLSAAERYNLNTASLQTTSTGSPGQQFQDATGRTFVAADEAGLKASAGLLRAQKADGTWALDYQALSTEAGAGAYPGGLPLYAVVPTEGLDRTASTKLGRLLCYAEGEGQVSGLANGQLPPGYLPLTKANGFGAQRAYLLSSVVAVRAQDATVPALDADAPSREEACDFSPGAPEPTPSPTPTEEPTSTPGGTDPDPAPGVVPVAPPTAPDAPGQTDPKPSDVPGAEPPATTEAATVLTNGRTSAFGRLGLPGLLVFALATGLAGSLMRWYAAIETAIAAAAPKVRGLARRTPRGGRRA